ncbi:E3 ubiquitin-protein ligase RNF186 [Erinaceus europaeus]|uniref:E3 ubiquitin-protein ligase RNF186 n=1 Tax=Erinaceus europaeus TaxID=9365 RepID=A0A1S3AH76_ERIEU|nr:E3 ubiquitin-protein ligase RNF186 [Erinaceus europaeus]
MASAETSRQPAPQQPQPISTATATATAMAPVGSARDGHTSSERDLECLVCRELYSCARPPKLLGCQHSFCAVCLKLLLCVQDDTWTVTCPLCRKATAVPGGLICSLRDLEAGCLARAALEVRLCPQGLAGLPSAAEQPRVVGEDGQDPGSANRVAARRLAAHLLLLGLLMLLILPLVYPGAIRWVLACIIALALLLSTSFCCLPSGPSRCRASPRTLCCRAQKHREVSSIA